MGFDKISPSHFNGSEEVISLLFRQTWSRGIGFHNRELVLTAPAY